MDEWTAPRMAAAVEVVLLGLRSRRRCRRVGTIPVAEQRVPPPRLLLLLLLLLLRRRRRRRRRCGGLLLLLRLSPCTSRFDPTSHARRIVPRPARHQLGSAQDGLHLPPALFRMCRIRLESLVVRKRHTMLIVHTSFDIGGVDALRHVRGWAGIHANRRIQRGGG